jgi:hypothetical protein
MALLATKAEVDERDDVEPVKEDREYRKIFAKHASWRPNSHLLFMQFDEREDDMDEWIWKSLRPEGDMTPFKTQSEDAA